MNELREMFEQHIECGYINMPRNEASGEIKGFAFVEVKSEDEIVKAVEALNGKEMGDRPLRVSKVLPKEQIRSKKTNRKLLEEGICGHFLTHQSNISESQFLQKLLTRTNCLLETFRSRQLLRTSKNCSVNLESLQMFLFRLTRLGNHGDLDS